MDKRESHGEQRVDARRARLRRPERLCLGITVDGDVVGSDGVDGAVCKRIDDSQPVVLGASGGGSA